MLSDTDTNTESPSAASGTEDTSAKRIHPARSEIAFPYAHLEDAVALVRAVAENGAYLSRDQTAAALGVSPGSGSFSWKVGAARMFRLIETTDGKYQLSDLGARIVSSDENEARAARREAFLNIELYQKTYESFRTRPLPGRPEGLENAFVTFGVPPKQKDKARLAFERSAQFAGFFHAGRDRLVEPIIGNTAAPSGRNAKDASVKDAAVEPPSREKMPPEAGDDLIRGMLKRLPPSDIPWPMRERMNWLRILAGNLAMIYTATEDQEIVVTLSSPPAKPVAEYVPRATASPKPAQAQPKPSAGAPSWDVPENASARPPTSGSASDLDDEIPF